MQPSVSGISSGASASFHAGTSPQTESFMPVQADSSSPQIPSGRDQQRCAESSLAIRTIRPLASEETSCPGKDVLRALLQGMSDMEPLGLGMGLGVSAAVLLADAQWTDAFFKMRGLLRLTDFPLSLEQLSDVLEQPPVRAYETAAQVRALARSRDVDWLVDQYDPLCDELARLLVPLAGEPEMAELAQTLGVAEFEFMAIGLLFCRGDTKRWNTVKVALDRGFAGWQEQQPPPRTARTCGDWLEVFARSGASADALQHIARCWELAPPSGCAGWTDYLQALRESIATQVVREHQQHPDAPVPLQQAWILVHAYAARPAFSLALDDATDPFSLEPDDRHLGGLVSLLRHAQERGPQANSISWSRLCRLAHYGCADPCFATRVELAPPAPETVSRRLLPADLLRLVEEPCAQQQAWAAAAALGVGALPVDPEARRQQVPERDAALVIWRRIYNRVPWLETGHLVQLLRVLAGEQRIEKLTGHADSRCWPAAFVSEHSARAAQFLNLAQVLEQHPERAQAFIRMKHVNLRLSYLAPVGTAASWRLLNGLAFDPLLLRAARSFLSPGGQPPSLPLVAAADEDGLEKNAEGYPCDYVCPLSRDYMDDPVAILEGNGRRRYFSRQCLFESLIVAGPFNPLTRERLSLEEVPAVDVEHLARIHAWRVKHPELEEEGRAFVPPGRQGT
ncbi:MAG: hypothetical protein OXC07_06180 [Kistimonas sp.]|nr:hypothetical protein [Kistimonas sp.]